MLFFIKIPTMRSNTKQFLCLFNQGKKLAGYGNPCLFLHAQGDHLVRIWHGEQNYAAAGSQQKELVRLPRGDHNSILALNQEQYFSKLAEFMNRLRP